MRLPSCQRLLVYGGTFDPPHVAHLILPRLAAEALHADLIAYIPAAQPPHKLGQPHTPGPHRLAMLRLALAGCPDCLILTDELERAKTHPSRPSYTVDTLEGLRAALPASTAIHLLIGSDQLRIFPTWHRVQRLVELADPAVMVRPPDSPEIVIAGLAPELAAQRELWRTRLLPLPQLDISASAIRRRILHQLPITGLVDPGVADYIRRHGLYGQR